MGETTFNVIMSCTIDGGSEVYEGFHTQKEAEDFVESSKQVDRDSEHETWFVYDIEPAVA